MLFEKPWVKFIGKDGRMYRVHADDLDEAWRRGLIEKLLDVKLTPIEVTAEDRVFLREIGVTYDDDSVIRQRRRQSATPAEVLQIFVEELEKEMRNLSREDSEQKSSEEE